MVDKTTSEDIDETNAEVWHHFTKWSKTDVLHRFHSDQIIPGWVIMCSVRNMFV